MVDNGRRRLTSWKEIATRVGRDVRTVLRWEKQRGLPVHRVPGATGRVVFAYTDELDAWAKGRDQEQETEPQVVPPLVTEPKRTSWRRPAIAAAIALAVVAFGAGTVATKLSMGPAAGEIARAVVTDAAVQAVLPDGNVLWTHALGRVVNPQISAALVTDVNADGHADVVASVQTTNDGAGPGILLALDHRGRKLWEHQAPDSLTFGKEPFGTPWIPDAFTTFTSGGQPFFAWALHHHTWWPSMVAVFNGKGERTATFVNSGWIRNVLPSRDGKYLLAGGISNGRNGAAFAILDSARPGGVSPEDAGSEYECVKDCPHGGPVRYFVIPWTDVIEPTVLGGRRGQFMSFPDGTIELRAVQNLNAEMIVELTPALEIKARRIGDGYWSVHAQMERDGLLKHMRDACPFKNGPTVLEWMPERGWRALKP